MHYVFLMADANGFWPLVTMDAGWADARLSFLKAIPLGFFSEPSEAHEIAAAVQRCAIDLAARHRDLLRDLQLFVTDDAH